MNLQVIVTLIAAILWADLRNHRRVNQTENVLKGQTWGLDERLRNTAAQAGWLRPSELESRSVRDTQYLAAISNAALNGRALNAKGLFSAIQRGFHFRLDINPIH